MTVLIVIAAVILFFALALNIKLRVQIKYLGGELDFKLKYLWFTVYPLEKKKTKRKPKKNKKVKNKKAKNYTMEADVETESEKDEKPEKYAENTGNIKFSENTEESETLPEKEEKEKLSDKLDRLTELVERIKIIWGFSEKHLRKIFTHVYIEKLMIDFVVAGEDACRTAVSYGTVSAAVYNGISLVSSMFPTKVKSVDIICDFDRKKPVYDAAVNITARVSILLAAALGILIGFLKNYKTITGKSDKRQTDEVAAQL